jgi:hypothetical protein
MHRPQHTRNESVDSVALLDERDEGGDSALVLSRSSEVSEDELLERVDLVLERHEVGDGLVSISHTKTDTMIDSSAAVSREAEG